MWGGRLDVSKALLKHSLQDYPSNQDFREGTSIVNKMKKSLDFLNKIASFYRDYGEKFIGDITFKNPTDLRLSVHHMKCSFRRSNGNCSFDDTYDFDYMEYANAREDPYNVTAMVNNIANQGQQNGAVVNYDIYVFFRYH